jgi:biopolymer transport protein ExbD
MHRRVDYYCRIDASAFAGVLLVLLLMFEFLTPASDSDFGQTVELARSNHSIPMSNALREDSLHVSITASGGVYFRNVKIPPNELASKIRDGLRDGAEEKVYVIADAGTHYVDIRPVLTEISLAGLEQIGIITR